MMKNVVLFFSSGLGSGYLPLMPGTWGTLAAALVFWLVIPLAPWVVALIALVLSIASVVISGAAEKIYGRQDDSRIVIDEWAGYFVSVVFLPQTAACAAGAFVLFRLFDVWKPLGIHSLQKLPGGWGVTVDDLAAGVLANLVLRGIFLAVGR